MSTRTTNRRSGAQPRASRPPVDPRVRARWVAARRAEGRRRLRWLGAIAAVIVLVAVAWGVTVSPLLAVDHVVVTGAVHTTTAQIETAAAIHPGDALVWLHTDRAAAAVAALPYVRTARVQRSWPHTVRIVVVERTPVAWVEAGGVRALVDGTARVLETVDAPPAGIPQLTGVAKVPAPGSSIAPAGGARAAGGLVGLDIAAQSVSVTPAGVSIQVASGPEIRLGQADQVAVKVRAAKAVMAAMGATNTPVHYVDVSVPSNPVAG